MSGVISLSLSLSYARSYSSRPRNSLVIEERKGACEFKFCSYYFFFASFLLKFFFFSNPSGILKCHPVCGLRLFFAWTSFAHTDTYVYYGVGHDFN